MWTTPLLYERLSWPEVRRAAAEERVCLVPVATLEDHGPHMPIDTDLRITAEICRRAAEAAPDEVVLLPAIPHGYSPHHMDFPGPITIGWDTFTRYLVGCGHLARPARLPAHPVPERARLEPEPRRDGRTARRRSSTTGCSPRPPFTHPARTPPRVIAELRESGQGGMAHACELETSMYLAIEPEAVEMDKAVDERSYPQGKHATMDWSDGPLKVMPWWSSFSRTGIQGDASKATEEKGRKLLDAAVAECVEFVRELLARPLPERLEPQETVSREHPAHPRRRHPPRGGRRDRRRDQRRTFGEASRAPSSTTTSSSATAARASSTCPGSWRSWTRPPARRRSTRSRSSRTPFSS